MDVGGAKLPVWVTGRGQRFIKIVDLDAAILHWGEHGWPDDFGVYLSMCLSSPELLSDTALWLLQNRYPTAAPAAQPRPVQADLFALTE